MSELLPVVTITTSEKSCNTCQNCCMDMDMDPYCAAVNKPWGQVLHRGQPSECGANFKLWEQDTRGTKSKLIPKPETKELQPMSKYYEARIEESVTFNRVTLDWNPPHFPSIVCRQTHDDRAPSHAIRITFDEGSPGIPRVLDLNELASLCHANSVEKGFYDPPPSFENRVALLHSEVSEALEEHRDGRAPTDVRYSGPRDGKVQKPEGIPSEFADIIIRVLDACAYYGIDIDTAVREKMAYNKTRPHKHGRVY